MALTDGLIEYWTMDSGGTGSLGSYNLSVTGATNTSAFINNGYDLDGTNDYLNASGFNPSSVIGTGDFTIAGWFNADALSGRPFIMNQLGTNSNYVQCLFITDHLEVWARVGSSGLATLVSSITLSTGTWYFVSVTRTGSTTTIRINDNTRDSLTNGENATGSFTVLDFGVARAASTSGYFNGKLDEFGIWNRVLSTAEEEELYNSGSGLQYPFTGGVVFTQQALVAFGGL